MSDPRYDKQAAAVDPRSEPRRGCWPCLLVRLAIRPRFRSFKAYLRDVSASGIAFFLGSPLQPGTVLALQLKAGQPGTSLVRIARVVHATPREGRWLIGCRLSPPFSAAQLEKLWDPD